MPKYKWSIVIVLAVTATSLVKLAPKKSDELAKNSQFKKEPSALAELLAVKRKSQLRRNIPAPIQPYAINNTEYVPASIEAYAISNSVALGYDARGSRNARTCPFIQEKSLPVHDNITLYSQELDQYNELVNKFVQIPDLRLNMTFAGDNQIEACNKVKLHPHGIEEIFKSKQLSMSSQGYMEPLLPTMRYHKMCSLRSKHPDWVKYVMSLEYLVHDFYGMCLKLKRTSRTVFVDMGASLDFHGSDSSHAVKINAIYRKFGFQFDHIYAYEITKTDASKVYELVPDELQAAWHWINVGVSPEPGDKMNPFTMLKNNYEPDDFVVVKLDVDMPAIEVALAHQLRNDPDIFNIVDHFYFEHHVHQHELALAWGSSMEGSVKDSLELMSDIRKRGVASHYWP